MIAIIGLFLLFSCIITYLSYTYATLRYPTESSAESEPVQVPLSGGELKKLSARLTCFCTAAKTQYKKLTAIQWGMAFLFSTAAAAAVAGAVANNADTVYICKTAVTALTLVCASVIDFSCKKIPNALVIFLFAVRILFAIPDWFLQREKFSLLCISALLGAFVCFFLLLIMRRLTKDGLGMGDVKLLSAFGFMQGISAAFGTIVCALLICMFYSIAMLLMRRKGKKDLVAFGPFIVIGFAAAMWLNTF